MGVVFGEVAAVERIERVLHGDMAGELRDAMRHALVVTHRKGTMSAADSIYGVTMQESGVSKIVSVKLKDLESM